MAKLKNLTLGEELDIDSGDDGDESLESTPPTPLSPSLSSSLASPALTRASSSFTSPELPQTPPGHLQQPQQQKTSWKRWTRTEGLDVLDDERPRAPQPQDCALMLHGIPALHASSIQVRVARREVAKEGLLLLDSDPTWLERYCSCPTRISKRKHVNK